MKTQQQKIDVTANNIANVNTPGYKKKTTIFHDLVYQALERRGNAVAPAEAGGKPSTVGVGAAGAIRSDLRPGNYLLTEKDLDVAIVGDGYFRVALPNGETAYTREGGFSLDGDRSVVTTRGYRVLMPELPAGEYKLQISPEGLVSAAYPDGETVLLGSLELARFNNPHGLAQLGDNLLAATAASGEAQVGAPGDNTVLMQGYLESSNVDLSEELVQMIVSQRAFELNSRALRTADEMWGIANQIRR
jgi:flagellar basal-body rod protein FlgG